MTEVVPAQPWNAVVLSRDCPTVWITRDSELESGALSVACDLWISRPIRIRIDVEAGACWIAPEDVPYEQCHLGSYTVAAVRQWVGVAPDTDLECIRVEGRPRG